MCVWNTSHPSSLGIPDQNNTAAVPCYLAANQIGSVQHCLWYRCICPGGSCDRNDRQGCVLPEGVAAVVVAGCRNGPRIRSLFRSFIDYYWWDNGFILLRISSCSASKTRLMSVRTCWRDNEIMSTGLVRMSPVVFPTSWLRCADYMRHAGGACCFSLNSLKHDGRHSMGRDIGEWKYRT